MTCSAEREVKGNCSKFSGQVRVLYKYAVEPREITGYSYIHFHSGGLKVDCYWFVYAWLNLASDEKGTEPDGADAGALTSR